MYWLDTIDISTDRNVIECSIYVMSATNSVVIEVILSTWHVHTIPIVNGLECFSIFYQYQQPTLKIGFQLNKIDFDAINNFYL